VNTLNLARHQLLDRKTRQVKLLAPGQIIVFRRLSSREIEAPQLRISAMAQREIRQNGS
jgi:hypothetical protein